MSSLTETTYYTRQALKYGIILIIAFFVLKFSLVEGRKMLLVLFPPTPPPPDMCFGKILAIEFPSTGAAPIFSPKLETTDYQLPTFPNTAKVYFMYTPSSDIFAWERAKTWAKQIDFTEEPEQETEFDLIFRNQATFRKVLKLNVLSRNFSLLSDYQNDFTLARQKNAPDRNEAISEAERFLKKAGVYTEELGQGAKEVIYFRFDPPNLESVNAVSEADLTLVNFFRKEIENSATEKIKIMPPNPRKSLVSVLVSGSTDHNKKILEVNYIHYPLSRQTFCTYYLKPIETAWKELQNNQVYLADFGQNFDGRVIIRRIYLAYFDPFSTPAQNESLYLQPIYVFEGDRDFMAYVSAIDPNSVYSK
jgi:hypothetical protein